MRPTHPANSISSAVNYLVIWDVSGLAMFGVAMINNNDNDDGMLISQ